VSRRASFPKGSREYKRRLHRATGITAAVSPSRRVADNSDQCIPSSVPMEYQRKWKAGKRRIRTTGSARLASTRRHARRADYLHRRPISAGDPAAVTRGGVSHAKSADRITAGPRETEKKDYLSNSDLCGGASGRYAGRARSRFREND